MANRYLNRWSALVIIREIKIKMRYYLTLDRNGYYKKTTQKMVRIWRNWNLYTLLHSTTKIWKFLFSVPIFFPTPEIVRVFFILFSSTCLFGIQIKTDIYHRQSLYKITQLFPLQTPRNIFSSEQLPLLKVNLSIALCKNKK